MLAKYLLAAALIWAAAASAVIPAAAQATAPATSEPEGISAAEAMDAVMWNKGTIGGPFALTDQDGRPRTDADFAGQVRLVYFGFTHCPDICPVDLAAIAGALNALGDAGAAVQPLFISLDPERDRPNLKIYLDYFSPRIVGLTGDAATTRAVANAFKIYYREVGEGEAYTIDHTAYTYLFDKDGTYRGFFPPGSDPKQIAEAVRPLLD